MQNKPGGKRRKERRHRKTESKVKVNVKMNVKEAVFSSLEKGVEEIMKTSLKKCLCSRVLALVLALLTAVSGFSGAQMNGITAEAAATVSAARLKSIKSKAIYKGMTAIVKGGSTTLTCTPSPGKVTEWVAEDKKVASLSYGKDQGRTWSGGKVVYQCKVIGAAVGKSDIYMKVVDSAGSRWIRYTVYVLNSIDKINKNTWRVKEKKSDTHKLYLQNSKKYSVYTTVKWSIGNKKIATYSASAVKSGVNRMVKVTVKGKKAGTTYLTAKVTTKIGSGSKKTYTYKCKIVVKAAKKSSSSSSGKSSDTEKKTEDTGDTVTEDQNSGSGEGGQSTSDGSGEGTTGSGNEGDTVSSDPGSAENGSDQDTVSSDDPSTGNGSTDTVVSESGDQASQTSSSTGTANTTTDQASGAAS